MRGDGRLIRPAGRRFELEGSMVTAVSRFLSVAALAVGLYAVPAAAQTGRISGMGRDAGGGPFLGEQVAVRDQATATIQTPSGHTNGWLPRALPPPRRVPESPSTPCQQAR